MATFKERLIAGITAQGWRQDLNERSGYTSFIKAGNKSKLFVGKSGALRLGECASRSFSIGDPTRQTPVYTSFLKDGDAVLDKNTAFQRRMDEYA
jgi:hypothetical protein